MMMVWRHRCGIDRWEGAGRDSVLTTITLTKNKVHMTSDLYCQLVLIIVFAKYVFRKSTDNLGF